MHLLLIFIIIPLTELWLLFQVADIVGGFETVLLVIITAFVGIMLLKSQSVATLSRASNKWQMGSVPAEEIIEGLMLAFCGALLLTPGFITDTIGFLILLPPVRKFLAARITQQGMTQFLKSVSGGQGVRFSARSTQWQARSFGGRVYEGKVTKSTFAANDDDPATPTGNATPAAGDSPSVEIEKDIDAGAAPPFSASEAAQAQVVEADLVDELQSDGKREVQSDSLNQHDGIEDVDVPDAPKAKVVSFEAKRKARASDGEPRAQDPDVPTSPQEGPKD